MLKFLRIILLISIFIPFGKKYAALNDYVMIDEPQQINSSQFTIYDSEMVVNKSEGYFSGDIEIKTEFSNITYYFGLYYLDSDNNEILYNDKEVSYFGLNFFEDTYIYSFKIPFSTLPQHASLTFKVSSTVLAFTYKIKFYISNPSKKIILDNKQNNRIYTSVSFKENSIHNPYFIMNPSYLIKDNTDVFYYDKYDFATLYIQSGGGAINNSYLYIYDNFNHFSSIGEVMDILDGRKKYIRLAFRRLNGSKQNHSFYFYEMNYVNPVTNIMYKNYVDGFLENQTALYMPLKYYEFYKNVTVGIEINNYYSGRYNLLFEFEISFLPNFRKDEVVINKGNEKVSDDDFLNEVKIWV